MNWILKRTILCLFWILVIVTGFVSHSVVPVYAQEGDEDSVERFEATFTELGYSERVLRGPLSYSYYSFGLPADWLPQPGSYLILNVNYTFAGQTDVPAILEVRLNGNTLFTENLEPIGAYQLRVDLPADALYSFDDAYLNSVQLRLLVSTDCEQARLASLIVYTSSSLNLAYLTRSIPIDLVLYPKPLYQAWGFHPNAIRFVLPSQAKSAEVQAAVMIASRLGELSSNSLIISSTLASAIQATQGFDEHLIVIGQPGDNPVLKELDLPIPFVERHLSLHSVMPERLIPGETFSYTLSVENPEARQTLSVIDRLPNGATWQSCSAGAQCELTDEGFLRWRIGSLAENDSISVTVQLYLDDNVIIGEEAEHTATLLDEEGIPINVDTLTSVISTTRGVQYIQSTLDQRGYFFARENLAISEEDGIVQELISPWNPQKAIIVVSGLQDEALLLAARALSAETRFPGMSGDYALIKAVDAVPEAVEPTAEDITFSSVGHGEEVIKATSSGGTPYTFNLPWGTSLTKDAFVALHFGHGVGNVGLVATLQVYLNDIPISGVTLNEENAVDAWMTVPLPRTSLEIGSNELEVRMVYDAAQCVDARDEQAWVVIYDDSFFHLPREVEELYLSLATFPQPFSAQSGLRNLVFLLPDQPSLIEVEGVIRLAARLGYAAGGVDFIPKVALGGDSAGQQWPGHQLIILGRPTTNRYISTLNDVLPQPFYSGTDDIWQRIDQVVYRLAPGMSVGLVQALIAPWDAEQALLVATGTTDEGVKLALNALIERQLSSQLAGNLALVRENSIDTVDTRNYEPETVADIVDVFISQPTPEPEPTSLPSPTPLPTVMPTPTVMSTPSVISAPAVDSVRPVWLVPLLIVSAMVVVIAVSIGLWRSRS